MMHAIKILEAAAATMQQRGKDNGYDKASEERSADHIARIYGAITGYGVGPNAVWTTMICVKLARLQSQVAAKADPTDTIIDLVAYCSLLGEELTK